MLSGKDIVLQGQTPFTPDHHTDVRLDDLFHRVYTGDGVVLLAEQHESAATLPASDVISLIAELIPFIERIGGYFVVPEKGDGFVYGGAASLAVQHEKIEHLRAGSRSDLSAALSVGEPLPVAEGKGEQFVFRPGRPWGMSQGKVPAYQAG